MAKSKQQPELTAEEKQVLRDLYEKKRKKLLAELSAINAKLVLYTDEDDGLIEQVIAHKNQLVIPSLNGYDKDQPLTKKAIILLSQLGKASPVRSVFDRMAQYEPEIKKDKITAKNKEAHLYGAIAYLAEKNNSVIRFKDKEGKYMVALTEWADGKGGIKPEYQDN